MRYAVIRNSKQGPYTITDFKNVYLCPVKTLKEALKFKSDKSCSHKVSCSYEAAVCSIVHLWWGTKFNYLPHRCDRAVVGVRVSVWGEQPVTSYTISREEGRMLRGVHLSAASREKKEGGRWMEKKRGMGWRYTESAQRGEVEEGEGVREEDEKKM